MAIPASRLELALRQSKTDDWYKFERLCRSFLASEADDFRAMANASGDGGRDGELYATASQPATMYQFSLRADWRQKLRETAARLKTTFPDVKMLVYMSNRQIGAAADEVRAELSRDGLFVDIRDESWFVDRANSNSTRSAAAQLFFDEIVTPTLDLAALNASPTTLNSEESRTLLCYLELQRHDDEIGKGFTRACFEALVRAALRGTSSANRLNLEQIYSAVHRFVPRHDLNTLKPYIDSALNKLEKKVIKHNTKTNDYHLAHEEQQRLIDVATTIRSLKEGFLLDIEDSLALDERITDDERPAMRGFISQVIERYLQNRGDNFASAITSDAALIDDEAELRSVLQHLEPPVLSTPEISSNIALAHADSILRTPSRETLEYLKLLSDCYTLFAFLAEVPDVQRVTRRIFDRGEIWLDTAVLLPAFAEYAEPSQDEADRPFIALFQRLKTTGIKRYITPGVLEELASHLQNCARYARTQSTWRTRVPYVAIRFQLAGNPIGMLPDFVHEFCDEHSPEADLKEFLRDELGIEVRAPDDEAKLDPTLRNAIVDYWQNVHEHRRIADEGLKLRLARHDAENYINALLRRQNLEDGYWLGYTAWWLTIDRMAIKLVHDVDTRVAHKIGTSPVLSLDFLIRYLSFGPLRSHSQKLTANPLDIFSPEIVESLPPDLVADAAAVRERLRAMSPRLRQRKIRYELDMQRIKYGEIHNAGLEGIHEKMRAPNVHPS